MQTSNEWWQKTKSDPVALNDWLVKQYRGEATAARRIREFGDVHATFDVRIVLKSIAAQEERHASWVLTLLASRGIDPNVEHAEERYWKATLPEVESFETGAAVGAHAEKNATRSHSGHR